MLYYFIYFIKGCVELIKIFRTVFSGEFLFALYIVVGSFKAAFDIPYIDETALLFGLTFIIAVKNFVQRGFKFQKKLIVPALLFLGIIFISFISLMYTPSHTYALEKIVRFSIIAGWCFFGVFFLFKNEESIKKFLIGLVFVSTVMATSLLSNGLSTGIGFQSTFGSSYVSLARVCAMGSLILLMYFLFTKQRNFLRYIALISALILFIPLIQSGARLPVLILILTLMSIPLSMIKFRNGDVLISKKIIPLFLMAVVVFVSSFVLYEKGYADTLVYRMEVMFNSENGGNSVEGRTSRFETAWDMSTESYFLGYGLGSFPLFYSKMDAEDYPHNLYLEILSELGIIALIIFVTLLVIALKRGIIYYKLHRLNPLNASVYIILLFWFINSFGSSSLTGDKVFYAMIALTIILPILSRNKELKTS